MKSFIEEDARVSEIRGRAVGLVRATTGDEQYNDINYVFPTFITTIMPVGLVGLMIAAIFAAAMSSIAAELNSLATATVIDTTLTGNAAGNAGGGVSNTSLAPLGLTVSHTTICGNLAPSGGDLFNGYLSTATISDDSDVCDILNLGTIL